MCIFFIKQINGGVLRILSVQVKDRGVYVCKIEGPSGVAQSSAIIEVESKCSLKFCYENKIVKYG